LLFDDQRLSPKARRALQGKTDIYLSVASLWEIAIKQELGKLELGMAFDKFLDEFIAQRELQIVPIETQHLVAYSTLALHHRDPFDRLIVAQAIALDLPIVASDSAFEPYPIKLIW
jgi:PIN domain nuclease of toxin-antitoxin system